MTSSRSADDARQPADQPPPDQPPTDQPPPDQPPPADQHPEQPPGEHDRAADDRAADDRAEDDRAAAAGASRRRPRSLASRVTLLTTIAVGLAVAFLAAGVYVTARMQLQSQLDDSLVDRARAAARSDILLQISESEQISTSVLGAADVRIAFVRQDRFYRFVDTQPAIPLGTEELAVARGEENKSIRTIEYAGVSYRVVAVPTTTPGVALVIAQSTEERDQMLSRLGIVSLVFGVFGVLGAGIAGWAVARNGLRPVRRLTSTVEGIARTQDLRPLPVEGDDEIARLATAFNQLLIALDASRVRQRRLVTDAGHELRTPLTSLRTNIDLLLQSDQSDHGLAPEDRRALLSDIGAQIDELGTLIGDLTELARDEPLAPVVGTVDLEDVVDQALERVRRRAGGIGFDVVTESWEVIGEADGLQRAVTNLLDNAVKWSPANGTVTVRLADGVLTVDDQGPGIAEEDRSKVFDRFWRAEESRTLPGSGLGLSIVRQVAERHAGSVRATAAPDGGARLEMLVPGVAGVPRA